MKPNLFLCLAFFTAVPALAGEEIAALARCYQSLDSYSEFGMQLPEKSCVNGEGARASTLVLAGRYGHRGIYRFDAAGNTAFFALKRAPTHPASPVQAGSYYELPIQGGEAARVLYIDLLEPAGDPEKKRALMAKKYEVPDGEVDAFMTEKRIPAANVNQLIRERIKVYLSLEKRKEAIDALSVRDPDKGKPAQVSAAESILCDSKRLLEGYLRTMATPLSAEPAQDSAAETALRAEVANVITRSKVKFHASRKDPLIADPAKAREWLSRSLGECDGVKEPGLKTDLEELRNLAAAPSMPTSAEGVKSPPAKPAK